MLEAAGGFEARFLLLNLLKHNFLWFLKENLLRKSPLKRQLAQASILIVFWREFNKEIASEASTGSSINFDDFLKRI